MGLEREALRERAFAHQRVRPAERQWQGVERHLTAGRQRHGAFHEVFQLADVARKIVRVEVPFGLAGEAETAPALLRGEAPEEMVCEGEHVLATLAQGRHPDL